MAALERRSIDGISEELKPLPNLFNPILSLILMALDAHAILMRTKLKLFVPLHKSLLASRLRKTAINRPKEEELVYAACLARRPSLTRPFVTFHWTRVNKFKRNL